MEIVKGLSDNVKLPFEANSHLITPYFRFQNVKRHGQSFAEKRDVFEMMEVCELRFAGDRNYSPVVPAESQWKRVGNRIITYAERYSDQYVAFKRGDSQTSEGTALDYLKDYGATPAQLSLLRAMKIYSIEALNALDGPNLKALGMSANVLKEMAQSYMADRTSNSKVMSEADSLRAEIERLKKLIPEREASEVEKTEAVLVADEEIKRDEPEQFANMTDDAIKEFISNKIGMRPRGNPKRETLIAMAVEAEKVQG